MAHEYKVGDRIRRTGAQPNFSNIVRGTEGTVIAVAGDGRATVRWHGDVIDPERYYSPSTFDCLELVSPAVEPAVDMRGQLGQHPPHWTQTLEPAAAVKVCSSECDDMRRELAKAGENLRTLSAGKLNVGDLLGERDHLRNDNHELTTRVAWLERELARAKGGRR